MDSLKTKIECQDAIRSLATGLDELTIEAGEKLITYFLQKLEDDHNGHLIIFARDKAQEMFEKYAKPNQ